MSREKLLKNADAIKKLALNLSRSEKVNSFDEGDNKESWTLATGFSDLEESFCSFLDVHLPKLMVDNIKPEEIEDILFDIGQEFNHILYHIKSPKYFRHMLMDYDS